MAERRAHLCALERAGRVVVWSGLAKFIASATPVAVTRHGQTVGYFIPTHGQADADMAALRKASAAFDRLLAAPSADKV